MKKAKIILSLLAFTFAIVGVFASRAVVAQPGYEFVMGGSPQCQDRGQCAAEGDFDCRFRRPNGTIVALRDDPNKTNCGAILRHNVNEVINPQ